MIKIIGLTGQTGAGKSTVAKIMSEYSCKIISADAVAREITEKESECLKTLAQRFGCDIINEDGSCNRKLLAKKAFSSRKNTDDLNKITHPFILNRTKEYILNYEKQGCRLAVFDAPQLFESGGDKLCSSIIAVTAPVCVRKERIMKRDNLTSEEAQRRIEAQYDEKYYTSKSDFIIDGSLSLEQVKKQILNIINCFNKMN